MRPLRASAALFAALALSSLCAAAPAAPQELDPDWFEGWHWREVGPYRGGRSAAVCGVPSEPQVYWFGACGGGVWKTTDGGRSWSNVSDGSFGGSVGAVAVSEWDPNVVYVGGGEKTVRGNVSHGDGVWRSDDAGKSWRFVGLEDTRHVPRIRIHPRDPDTVYVAALGHLFGPNAERGVYRSRDGGATWQQVLFVSEDAGCVDLCMDPSNPRVLYASFWRVRRTPSALESGGEGSGLWRSTDGGDTWTELSRNPGLPQGTWGISGVSVSASNPDSVYAIVEAEDGGVFRSRDGGATWKRTSADRELRQRAWYYTRIFADPADEDVVYVTNVRFWRSKDGGRTFESIRTPHGDNHDLWIAPDDPARMIESNDGGANVTFDGGRTWTAQDNQPTAQMYRVSTDDAFPYRLLGGQQDNSTVRIRSRSLRGGRIGERDWEPTAGGESGHVVARPGAPDVVYGGSYGGTLVRLDHRTGDTRSVDVWPDEPMGKGAGDLRWRFQWNFPLFFSPHDPDTLYAAANALFRTRDEGASWEVISPDLTRADPTKLGPSGGPITKDNTSVEYYCTIFAAFESPLAPGTIWAGSDDGLVHVTRDGGETWSDVTPPALPEWTMINCLEPHPTEPGGCYLAGTRYKLDDFEPCLFATTDHGATWRRIDAGIPRDHFTRALRADPDRAGLLYAGTERGVYVSLDDGASWSSLQLDLPVVPVTDLAVKDGDLIAATQGRGYWILDDLSPLHQLDPAAHQGAAVLFVPRPTPRVLASASDDPGDAGANPEAGVVISYMLPEELEPGTEVALEVRDAAGALIRRFTPRPAPGEEPAPLPAHQRDDPRQLETGRGFHRFTWNLRHPAAEGFEGLVMWNRSGLAGPRAVPGRYEATLVIGEARASVPIALLPDPRGLATQAELEAQLALGLEVRDRLTAAHRAVRTIRALRGQLEEVAARADADPGLAPVAEAARAIVDSTRAVEEALHQTRNESAQDPLNFPVRLNDRLAKVASLVAVGQHAPTAQQRAVFAELDAALGAELAQLERVLAEDLPALNALAAERGLPAATPPSID